MPTRPSADVQIKTIPILEALAIAAYNLPGYFYCKDLAGMYVASNRCFDQLHHNTLTPIHSQTQGEFIDLDTLFQKDEQRVMFSENAHVAEYKLILSNSQKEIWLQFERTPLYDSGQLIGVQCYGLDITHQKHFEQPLIQIQETQNAALIHNLEYIVARMPGYIYWKDQQSRYIGCNDNMVKISGLTHYHELLGKTDFDFEWGKDNAAQFVADDQIVMKQRITQTTEYSLPVIRNDGHKLVVQTNKMPLINKNNEVIGVLAIAVDITEQKLLEEKLIQEKENVERLSRAKTEFMRNMEHDIRTPFSGIYTIANILCQQEENSEKKEYLSMVAQSAKELLDYCNNIVDFSRLESGNLPVIHKKFNVRSLLKNIIDMERPAAQAKALQLHLEIDPKIPQVLLGDPYRLQRILINIFGNAIKFTHQGFVKIYAQLAQQRVKEVILRISIEDTGIGIAAENLDLIYERFLRLNPSNQGTYKGSGLGLTIVKQLIEELNGEIDALSNGQTGTTFICTLPFQRPLIEEVLS